MLEIWLVMAACAPEPIDIMAITAATPMMIPSMVSPERTLFDVRLSIASIKDEKTFMVYFLLPARLGYG